MLLLDLLANNLTLLSYIQHKVALYHSICRSIRSIQKHNYKLIHLYCNWPETLIAKPAAGYILGKLIGFLVKSKLTKYAIMGK